MTYAKHMTTPTAQSAPRDAAPAGDGGLASALRMSTMRLARRLRAERAGEDSLTLTQLATLATLDRHGELTLTGLAAHEHVRPPSMTRVVTVLEEQGLVARAPHPTDGRQVVVSITAAGADLLSRDRARRDAWLARRLEDLDASDLEALRRVAPVLERLARE